jgi:pyruvate,water dikinase
MATTAARRFPSPFELATPEGAEGWESMYPPYLLFSEENREWEENSFWFLDSLHRPEVEYPFDTIVHEAWNMSAGNFMSRAFAIPAAKGLYNRVLNGRLYTTTIPLSGEAELHERVPIFTERGGHYFQNWGELYDGWTAKMDAAIAELKAIEIPHLPDLEDASVVFEGRGVGSGFELINAYDRAIQNIFRVYQYHFEMVLLGYAAYLNLNQFCKQAFPGIADQTIANLSAGADILLFRPDDELKVLARKAIDLGVADELRSGRDPEQIVRDLASNGQNGEGSEWAAAFEKAKDPWFYYSTGTGLYHHERSWIDDISIPFSALTSYIDRLERGESIERPTQELLDRRDRIADEYRGLLGSEAERTAFDQNVGLARTVAPLVEDHNFYIEHHHHTIFWNKMREIGDRMATHGLLNERDDLFYLNRWEAGQALYDLTMSWAASGPSRDQHWKSTVGRRREIVEVLRDWAAEPALGPVGEELREPLTIMLWGITPERLDEWLGGDDEDNEGRLKGIPGSSGSAEGLARVITSPDQIPEVQEGEILVCPITAPSWGPVFGKIAAAVSDMGGVMCHAAIVCREYGLPAVVGTGRGTKVIKTGDRVRVDGDTGVVEVLA